MTNEQAKKMLKAKLECLKRETSGTDFDCNNSNCDECSLCYEQGNMGEQKEALDMAIKALEQKPYEKFESAKDHIYKLAGDYKCWDNRLTEDEAVELCHILEQQPCEDAISRQAAIDAVKKNTFRLTFAEEQNCEGHVAWSAETVYSDVMEGALLELPPAQPERKKGKWIRHDEIKNVYGGICIECSECGEKYVVQHILDEKYCRNCGADMRGEL